MKYLRKPTVGFFTSLQKILHQANSHMEFLMQKKFSENSSLKKR